MEIIENIEISKIKRNENQPRKVFDVEMLNELAESIKEHGVIQPIILIDKGDYYQIVAGERRWRASIIAGLDKIPAIVRNYDEKTNSEVALIENIQRENLNPIEKAEAIKKLMCDYNLTQEVVAKRLGMSRSALANTVRLLNLDSEIIELAKSGKLTEGHCRAIMAIKDVKTQKEIANRIIETSASVREVENMVKRLNENDTISIKNEIFKKISTDDSDIIQVNNLNKWRSAEEQCVNIEKYLGNKAIDVSKQNLGYDIESIDKNNNKRYIEVKSITSDTSSFTMTNNEYSAANIYKDNYYLCLLIQTNKKIRAIYINNPIKNLELEKRVKVWEWYCEEYSGKEYIFNME